MATGTGIDAQLGAKLESTYGTAVTVDRFFDFDSESLLAPPTWKEPAGLRAGRRVKRASRLAQIREQVSGGVVMRHATRDMNLWWKLALASPITTPVALTAPAQKWVHQLGQSVLPPSATVQVGKPEPESGTVQPHTFLGCIATGWELSIADDSDLQLSLTIDGQRELTATALAAAAYTAGSEVFDFQDASVLKLGGTPSTTGGVVSIAAGVQMTAVVRSLTLSGSNPAATERFGVGNAGLKKHPRYNDFAVPSGQLTVEYLRSELYTPFKSNTTTAFQLSFLGSAIGASGSVNTLDIIGSAMKFKNVGPQVGGPDLVTQTADVEFYDDDVNSPFQVTIISADSAL